MKKNWNKPELVELDMKETFGGPVNWDVIDYIDYNNDLKVWERWRGEDEPTPFS